MLPPQGRAARFMEEVIPYRGDQAGERRPFN